VGSSYTQGFVGEIGARFSLPLQGTALELHPHGFYYGHAVSRRNQGFDGSLQPPQLVTYIYMMFYILIVISQLFNQLIIRNTKRSINGKK
jgi:hypothetical protein